VQSEPIPCLARDCCGTNTNDDVGKLNTPCSRSSPTFDRATYHMYTSSDPFAASTTMDHNQIPPLSSQYASYVTHIHTVLRDQADLSNFPEEPEDVPSPFDFLTRPRFDSTRLGTISDPRTIFIRPGYCRDSTSGLVGRKNKEGNKGRENTGSTHRQVEVAGLQVNRHCNRQVLTGVR
jgi:hypothetical protein